MEGVRHDGGDFCMADSGCVNRSGEECNRLRPWSSFSHSRGDFEQVLSAIGAGPVH